MNKTNIEWTDFTWNPITGCTKHCPYCYANRLAKGRLRKFYLANPNVAPGCDPDDPFSPRLWPKRLHEPRRQSTESKIFTCDMGDLWDPHVPPDWTQAVLNEAEFCWWHTFQFLTKQSQRASQFIFPHNAWVGITIENNTLENHNRKTDMSALKAPVRFISYEPLLAGILTIPAWANWIIIGAMTGPKAIKPQSHWVHTLIHIADRMGIPVFLKDNLGWPEVRQEWPKGA